MYQGTSKNLVGGGKEDEACVITGIPLGDH